jgi:hypothetical protein
MSLVVKALLTLMLVIGGYIAFEACQVEQGASSQIERRASLLEYSAYGVGYSSDEFDFQFYLDATERLQSTEGLSCEEFRSSHPILRVPDGCKVGLIGSAGRSARSYPITCGDPLYSRLASYIDKEKARGRRIREDLPFDIADMSVAYEIILGMVPGPATGLGITARPIISKTELNKEYHITVYDEDGYSRGHVEVAWTRPELNAKSEKFLGPFELSRNELDAYGEGGSPTESMDLRPFFSVLMNTEDFDDDDLFLENLIEDLINNGGNKYMIESSIYRSESEIEDWIERNVSISVGSVQGR